MSATGRQRAAHSPAAAFRTGAYVIRFRHLDGLTHRRICPGPASPHLSTYPTVAGEQCVTGTSAGVEGRHRRTVACARDRRSPIFDRRLLTPPAQSRCPALPRITTSCSRAAADDLLERLAAVGARSRSRSTSAPITACSAGGCAVCPASRWSSMPSRPRGCSRSAIGPRCRRTRRRCRSGSESLDLVVSGLALQFVNDLPGTLVQIRRGAEAGWTAARRPARRRHASRVANIPAGRRGGDRRRRQPARGSVRRRARPGRAAAARAVRAARRRFRHA